jgi:hypothetical protein
MSRASTKRKHPTDPAIYEVLPRQAGLHHPPAANFFQSDFQPSFRVPRQLKM